MIRTKYLAVVFAFLIVALVVFLLYLGKGSVESAFSAAPGGRALVIDAIGENDALTVVVEKDTTREDTRASIIAQLKDFTPPTEEEVVIESEPEIPPTPEEEPAIQEEEVVRTGPIFCESTDGYVPGLRTWDGMTALVGEGVRLVRSLEEREDASPLHFFQVAPIPSITGSEGCLPLGMIGVAQNGTLIQAGSPFVAQPEGLVGYALDGFGIFGMYEGGAFVTEESLDACHGHIHAIMWDESLLSMYHYHVTESSPYTLGCFRGAPAIPQ